ncbi:MAG TPA: molybdopterin-dependent oxidoreductase [Pirellulales bacterium]|jgi:DMSO/TMAO reductase YedYZ molybdopterin-dependent catalytic subunit|nr:molybdopterin-dependent oxidoreductase [Pirellulales bacterium]
MNGRVSEGPVGVAANGSLGIRDVDREMRRLTRRSFSVGAAAAIAGCGAWAWLRTRPHDDGLPWPLRRVLSWNERLAEALFDPSRLASTFSPERAREPRVNGRLGLTDRFDPAAWKLRVHGAADPASPALFDLAAIKSLPRVEMVTELKCIEGWSTVVRWAGATFRDFADKWHLAPKDSTGAQPRYVSLATPDERYFVGLDMASALHAQTLLCYEMNGRPLSLDHGGPLRLITPLKYGIKHIKRIGTIRFTGERPADYWAQRGYDWYAGH